MIGREEIVMGDDDVKLQNNNDFQGGESNDRISSLPDSLIQHILSFLPTEYVVQTEILSKRWKSLWIGVPSLDIEESRFAYSYGRFMNLVDKVLLLRDGSTIQQFRLSLSYAHSFRHSSVQSLIAVAISHKLQQLDITLCEKDQFTLPCSIFDCRSLRILKLSMNCTLELPDHISLPSLKVMHLHFLAFQNAESIKKMLSCCPILVELALEDCKWINLDSITISIPSLKILTIGDSSEEYDNSCSITVEAPALVSFNYTGPLTNHLNLTKASSSIKAFIDITGNYLYRKERAPRLVKLLQDLENMVSLKISNETAEVLSVAHPLSNPLPVFHHLEYLDLSMKVEGGVFKWLLYFLDFLPNLGAIQFSEGIEHSINTVGLRWMPKPLLPNCLSSSLKFFGLGNFGGLYHEIFFLKSFLERAVSLQRVNICQNHEQQPFRDEVEKLPTRFKHCAIIVQGIL